MSRKTGRPTIPHSPLGDGPLDAVVPPPARRTVAAQLPPPDEPRQRVFVYLSETDKEDLMALLFKLRRHGVRLTQTQYFERLHALALPRLHRAASLRPGDPEFRTLMGQLID